MYIKPYSSLPFPTLLKLDKEIDAMEQQEKFLKKKCSNKRNKTNKKLKRKRKYYV